MPTTALAKRAGSGRVTPKNDLPKLRKGESWYVDQDTQERFRLSGKVNVFNLMAITASEEEDEVDTASIYRLIMGMVVEEERGKFKSYLSKKDDLDAAALNKIMTAMFKAVSGRNPTDSPSDSALTPKPITSRRRSAAS